MSETDVKETLYFKLLSLFQKRPLNSEKKNCMIERRADRITTPGLQELIVLTSLCPW